MREKGTAIFISGRTLPATSASIPHLFFDLHGNQNQGSRYQKNNESQTQNKNKLREIHETGSGKNARQSPNNINRGKADPGDQTE
jgi:hypothetical protein